MNQKGNIFDFANVDFSPENDEKFDTLFEKPSLKIERIVSWGQTSPEDFWYDQPYDEWILLIRGEACVVYDDQKTFILRHGDYMLIPTHQKHKVTYTSTNPECVWLTFHAK